MKEVSSSSRNLIHRRKLLVTRTALPGSSTAAEIANSDAEIVKRLDAPEASNANDHRTTRQEVQTTSAAAIQITSTLSIHAGFITENGKVIRAK